MLLDEGDVGSREGRLWVRAILMWGHGSRDGNGHVRFAKEGAHFAHGPVRVIAERLVADDADGIGSCFRGVHGCSR